MQAYLKNYYTSTETNVWRVKLSTNYFKVVYLRRYLLAIRVNKAKLQRYDVYMYLQQLKVEFLPVQQHSNAIIVQNRFLKF